MNNYSQHVQRYFNDRQNAGSFKTQGGENPLLAQGCAGHGENGHQVIIQIQANQQGKILQAKFKAYGGVATLAACAWVTEWLQDKTLEEALRLTESHIRQALQLSPLKRHSTLLVYQATQKALSEIGQA